MLFRIKNMFQIEPLQEKSARLNLGVFNNYELDML